MAPGPDSAGRIRVRFTAARTRIGTRSASLARSKRPCAVPATAAILSTCAIAFSTPEAMSTIITISATREKRRAARTA